MPAIIATNHSHATNHPLATTINTRPTTLNVTPTNSTPTNINQKIIVVALLQNATATLTTSQTKPATNHSPLTPATITTTHLPKTADFEKDHAEAAEEETSEGARLGRETGQRIL